jgi:hypothetical protein
LKLSTIKLKTRTELLKRKSPRGEKGNRQISSDCKMPMNVRRRGQCGGSGPAAWLAPQITSLSLTRGLVIQSAFPK